MLNPVRWRVAVLLFAAAILVVTVVLASGLLEPPQNPNAGNPHIAMNAINSIVKAATK